MIITFRKILLVVTASLLFISPIRFAHAALINVNDYQFGNDDTFTATNCFDLSMTVTDCIKNTYVEAITTPDAVNFEYFTDISPDEKRTAAWFYLQGNMNTIVSTRALDPDWQWGRTLVDWKEHWHCAPTAFSCNVDFMTFINFMSDSLIVSIGDFVIEQLNFAPPAPNSIFGSLIRCNSDTNGPDSSQLYDRTYTSNCEDSFMVTNTFALWVPILDPAIVAAMSVNPLKISLLQGATKITTVDLSCNKDDCSNSSVAIVDSAVTAVWKQFDFGFEMITFTDKIDQDEIILPNDPIEPGTPVAVPEPSSALLFSLALFMLGGLSLRRLVTE